MSQNYSFNHLETELQSNESGWKGIQDCFGGIFPSPVSVLFLYNAVKTNGLEINREEDESLKKKRKERTRTIPRTQMDLTKPIKVLSQTSTDDSYKTKMQIWLEKLYEVCCYDEKVHVPFFNFAINCKSYIQTVYNIFILSFLVREHSAVISVDDNHQLWIRPAHKYKKKDKYMLNNSQNSVDMDETCQMIVSLNPKEWNILTKALGLRTSMLPDMWPHHDFLGNKNIHQQFTSGVFFVD